MYCNIFCILYILMYLHIIYSDKIFILYNLIYSAYVLIYLYFILFYIQHIISYHIFCIMYNHLYFAYYISSIFCIIYILILSTLNYMYGIITYIEPCYIIQLQAHFALYFLVLIYFIFFVDIYFNIMLKLEYVLKHLKLE